MKNHHLDDLEALVSLADPVRRHLYALVSASARPVSRDEAAGAVDVSRQVAAYHLDRLAEDGLLDVEFRRLTGREGPGAGRPSKLYMRSGRTYDITIPPRRYELAARILLEATKVGHLDTAAVTRVARRTGVEMGQAGLDTALKATGYEPAVEDGEVRFRNGPVHVLRDQDRETTCGINLALVEGIIEGAQAEGTPVLEPEEGYCCVRICSA